MITGVLAIFAIYRLARMLAQEEGPFEICTWVRNLRVKNDWIGRGLRCPLCIGFWLALGAVFVIDSQPILVWWLGMAGAQAALQLWLGDGHAE